MVTHRTVEQRAQYLEVLKNELDSTHAGLVSVWDFAEFTAEHGLRSSCMQLFLRLILTFGRCVQFFFFCCFLTSMPTCVST